MTSRAVRWCFTINNYTTADIARLADIDCQYLIFGRETGANGTPHLQGYIEFHGRKRFNAAKAEIGTTAHLEVAKGTAAQNRAYCTKDNDFEEFGDPKNLQQGKRTDWERLREWLSEFDGQPSQRDIINEFPGLYARYADRLREIVSAMQPPVAFTHSVPNPGWQQELVASFADTVSPRQVKFYVDPVGNIGKTWLCQYILQTFPTRAAYMTVGKRDDMAYAIDPAKDIYLIDVPRKQMQYLQYSVLEMMKNRLVFSPKYSSMTKVLHETPHVVVFCNEPPDYEGMSSDRFDVFYPR